ncbi:MAG: ABC transporter permease [Actinomycetota bacterium]
MSDDKRPADRRLTERRLSAPGRLSNRDGLLDLDAILEGQGGAVSTMLPPGDLAEFAVQHGLRPSAQRPPVREYLRQLWRRWNFIMVFATARNIAMYTEAKLGQLWQVLTPVLNAGVYFLVFGLLLHVSRGVPNYLPFLVTGVFVFNFTQRAFISTSKVITDSLPLIRALQFPRAALPLAYVIIEFQQMLLSMAVLVVIVLSTGEVPTVYWLLAIPALLLQTVFNVGVGLFVARIGSQVNDFSQLLPFLLRTWMYMSGVLFSIAGLAIRTHQWIVVVLQINPAALYISLMRASLLASDRESQPGSKPYDAHLCALWKTKLPEYNFDSAYCHGYANTHYFWLIGAGWALLALFVGFFFFWRAEAKYGRG